MATIIARPVTATSNMILLRSHDYCLESHHPLADHVIAAGE